ncbi:hypothetical protein HK105_207213 [Polyrhizophydium stewartii]|uniref:Carrier domain-containing protein n=1 Tax=Polyrhizophydium stewartii TaxID=2732419 RepID=A0ABR4N1E3_9FUNG
MRARPRTRTVAADAAPPAPLSLGGPRSSPGLVPPPATRTVLLPAAAGLSTSAVAVATAVTVAKFKSSSDVVMGIALPGTDSAARTIVPVRIVLDDSATVADAVSAAAESIRVATEHSPVDLAQVRAWCGLSPSDPVCDAVLCVGKASNAPLAADLASTGATIALVVDTSADGGSVTSIHDGHMLDDDQAASVVNECTLTVGRLVSALAGKGAVGSLLEPRADLVVASRAPTELKEPPSRLDHTAVIQAEVDSTFASAIQVAAQKQQAEWLSDTGVFKKKIRRARHSEKEGRLHSEGDPAILKDETPDEIIAKAIGLDLKSMADGSFLQMGINSVAAIRLAAQAQEAGIALTAADLMSGRPIKDILSEAAKRGRQTFVWPKVELFAETLAELTAVGDFVDAYPATPLQAGMVAATMQDARAYVNQVPLRATRTVSLESLRGALRAVVQHHAILRTSFVSTVAGGIVQVVRASADAAECVAVAAPLAQHLAADKARGFSLADASWIRAALVCDPAGSAQHVVVTIHHALYDGWSLPMIMRDLAAALDGHALEPRPAFRTIVDFIAAQDAAATEAFWTQQLVGLEPAQPLSLGHSARTDGEDTPLAQACSTPMAELQRAAQRAGVTVAVVLKAAWAATLRKFTRWHDVVFGEVRANRDIAVAGADRIVGPLLNTVPCRVVLDDTARAADLVASLQAQHGAVLSHSHAALVDVQRWAGVQGDGKLFNTLFVYQDIDFSIDNIGFELEGGLTNVMNRATDFDLIIYPSQEAIICEAVVAPHLSRTQAASILAEFDFGVQQLVSALSDKATIESLWTLSPAQQAAIARLSHGERVPLPFALVHHGFEARVKQHPDWRAVEHGDAHLSYGDLDACGCALAAALASHGVQRGSRVAVVMQRSIEFVVALVGVLKAGATIVPVDSSFPADRIQFMLDDASVCAIVTTASEADRIAQLSVGDRAVVVADARALLASGVSFTPAAQHMATSDDDAFIVYTSGSTGRPKGVPIRHHGIVNVAINCSPLSGFVEGARVPQFMAIGFDVCIWEVWGSLSNGATLVIRSDNVFDSLKAVDAFVMTPTGLRQLGSPSDWKRLKAVTVTGEMCSKELKDLWSPHVRFVNGGCPTEATIVAVLGALSSSDPVYYGKPIPNMYCRILDLYGQRVPLGVVGEMCLGGIGVSRGYINLPDMTAQRFVPDPFSPEPGARMFRTGDLGRLLPDGNFEILGRMDDQVKLKGYRIELDEVAAAMMRHPRVSAAAAVVKDKSHLVGFVVPADVDHDELRDVVAAALPAYMVPAVFVGLAVMPTNTNGKTDKKALAAMHVEIAVDALQTDTERALAAVWSQVLGVQVADIGRATSFFALGGDSISAIRLVAKAKQQGLTLSSALIFKAPTLAKMALAATVSETRAAVSSAPVTGSVALTPIQHMFFAHDWINISHFNQSFVVKPRDTLDIAALTAAIARLAEHHDMLRARFAQGDDGAWSQTLLPPSPQTDAANVLAVVVESDDDALACIREAQESLSITHGPLLAVRLLHMHDGSQRLFFGIHHLVVDLVSWRVLLDDLETLLRGRPLAPKTLSFQAWAARMAAHAATLDAAPWRDLIGDHTTLLATQPPAAGVPVRSFHARAVLDEATTAQLDAANAPFNTNIQELVLAALVLSLADVAGCASSPAQLCIELEGHGREPFAADLDVSSTVGWFTSVFPVAFSALTASDIGAVVRQVKHKIRSVPLKGLSYGMIKHLAPPTADNAFVKAHGGHAVAFNYLGRFQSLEAADAYFVADTAMSGYWSVRHDDRMMHAISLNCAHDGPQLVLSATVEDWIVSEPTMQAWLDRWQVWMQRVVAHCVDPATHGGRTVSDVPLMPSQAAVEQAETELAAVLSLRARDIVDMYPVTPLQAGFLSAMMRDSSEYTVQSAFGVTGNMDVQRLRAAWHAVAMAHPIVRTVFVSTPSGLVQAVAKDDRTEWTELDGVWSADDDALQAATDAFMAADRARGFSMASASFHRFAVAHVANGCMRVFWTQHHSVVDGWSLPILTADLMRACAGAGISAKRVQFRDHVEWLLHQDTTASEQFWRKSLVHAADAGRLAPPKPRESELTGAKYGELHTSVDLPHLAAVCKAHGVTTSTVLRLAWALVLRHFTRSEHVLFGSVVSGRDGGIDGIDEIVGVMINTIAVPARLPLDTSVATALADMQSFSADAIGHSHVGLVDAQRAAGMSSESKLFDTIMVFENYPLRDAGVPLDFRLEPVKAKEFVDTTLAVAFVLQGSVVQIKATFEKSLMPGWFAHSMNDKLVDVLIRLCCIARFSHGERVPLPFSLVHHGFEARAKQHPDWRAVEHGDAHLSYGDLDACGCALAAALASHGVQRGSRVAVVMQRSIEFVVALVGVLKAGATIVPVDSSFPADRIQFMLDDASVCAIVTTASEADRIAQLSVGDRAVVVADARALLASGVSFTPEAQHTATGDDDAFIVYTSGSTGKPKGVPVPHKGVVNVCSSWASHPICRGSKLSQSQARLFPWSSRTYGHRMRFNNAYGPTEISIISHLHRLDACDHVHLGQPIANTSCRILDQNGRCVPVGVVGEMCLGGIGVSRGYINLPDLTAQRFVPDPFSPEPGARMFRTGDLGRLLPDGNFEILGRMDDQVKLKGYRIELDEVAAAMMRHPRVSAAAAVVKDKTHLVGFVVPADVDHDELRDVVAAALPAYMVPAVFVGLAVMPTNTNGKTDKKALAAMHVEIAVDALQTDTERALAAVWSQVLGVQVADIGRATSFFALGGDSISAIKAAAAMQRAGISITVPQLFKAQTVARVAALADAADAHDGQRSATEWPAAVLSDETLAELAVVGTFDDAYPATPLQAGMVAATMQDARAYVNQVPLRATRTVSLESLRGALRAVVQHHAILRTSFVSTVAGGIVQVVRASADAAECVAVAAPLAQHLAADKARGFSLADASWIRAALVCDPAGSAQHVVVTIHHALYDGWSLPMIMRDLAAALDGHALEPRPAFRTVVDFIAAQDAAATEAFWTQQLVGLEPAQPLSLGHSARTDDEDAPLAQACSTPMAELQRAAQRAGVTVAVVLKAAWAATLRKFTRSHDVVFGEVLANRDIAVAGADRIVGPLLNTVPCRVVLDDTARAADLVASLQAQHGAVLSHSHAALVDVQRWAGVQGDGKLFNTLEISNSKSLSYSFELILHPSSEGVDFVAQFDHSHLSRSQAASILAEFDFGVQQLVSALSDKATVESLWTLSPAQQAQIARFSHGERVPLPFSLVHHGFEARAKQHPDWRAVEHGDAHLSYGDLDACGCALAAALASHGVQRGSRVAVVMQRSIEFVVALVGVLKAGATIVPVDSSFPADRIQFMLDDASVCAIVTTASEAGRIAQLSVGDRAVVVADARALLASGVSFTPAAQHTATGDDDAFIVYTSGSTGKPKGVPVPHKGVVNVVTERSRRFNIQPGDRQGQFMAISFDACQSEIWLALSNTCTLVLREDEALKTASRIKTLFITPTGLAHLGSPNDFENIKNVSVGGEICTNELKNLWSGRAQFDNAYGPTEISIISHAARLTQFDDVSIGRPIQNMSGYILDSRQRQAPVGAVGEMCLGGIGVSRGYINLPDMTAQRFVPDPFSPEPGARMFRTGDLGRLLPDGNFEILGRMDDQVKLKGYRIELDEVAAAMMRHPRVSAAAAVVKDKTHLVGFVVPADVDHDELRDVVAAALPAYMVPAVFVGLAVMPTNTNGKTDKKALAAMHVEIAVDALQTDTERALAAVWSQVLGVQVADIGRATSFFALGGDSISAIRLVAKAKQQGLTLSSALIFKAPTLAKMALAATVTETRAAVSSAPVTGSVALTPIQHMFFAHDWINISHFNQSFVVKPRDTLDIGALTAAIARLAEHHDMLRARFAQGDDGAWSQTLLPPSPQTDAANVLAVVESDDDALACIREAQESLSITDGPLLAVRLLHMHDGSQRLFFGIHHLVVDLVSWRVLLDDLETLLRGRPLAPKTLSFQAWAARMAAHAATLDAAPWRDLIGDHTTLLATQPPAAGVPVRAFHARAVLDEATTAQLDAANAPFNTNIQELVLAALVLSLADVAGCASSPAQLCIELEGHGREPFAADLDVSSTVGWFTSVFPVAFSASTASDIGAVVRQVKHKIRSVPLKGLSYGMIKHLAPPTADNAFVKAHGGHAVAFNYLGRFQSLEAADAYFVADTAMSGYWSVRHDDRMMHAISLNCAHDGPRLVLSATVEGWIVSEPTMQAWLDSWQVWMQRVVAHCVDPATHGGRTVSDVPLMPSQAAVEQAEAELAAVLSLRARDIVDMYPVTPLQAGFLSAMMRDASEYTVQSAFDVTGNMDVQRLRAAWHAVAMAHPIVRTVFVSTPSGLVQAVAKDDRTEWTELDGVWSADDDALQAATDAFMAADRARGFSMASASFHRFAVAHVASIEAKRVQFRDHVEWLLHQDTTASEQFWRKSLVHAADAGRLAPPKPRESELTGAKYGELHTSVDLPHLAAVCKAHGVTTSTVLRLAWALVLRHFTRNEHVLFGSVVSGRDGGIDGIDEIVGVMINTIAVPARLPLDASVATALAATQSFSANTIAHSHISLVDAQRAAGMSSESKLFDTIMVFENYPLRDAGVPLDFRLEPIKSKEFVDQPVSVVFVQQNTTMQVAMTFETLTIQDWFAQSMADKLVDVLSLLCAAGGDLGAVTIADIDALTESQQAQIARFSHGERVPLPFSLVHHGFEARAKQHPDWRAVEHGDAHLSYGDLDACGCALAAALASHGVQRGSRVAVVMQRSIEFVVALVGVLKAGATIVPVDSSFPADRIQFMLDDASVCAVVTTTSEAGRIAQLSVGDRAVVVADARALLASGVSFTPVAQHTATGDDDAFIVYTSGTTGRPKGVVTRHIGLVGFVKRRNSWLSYLGSPLLFPKLKTVTVGGEACPEELKDKWAPYVQFNNLYGPSEVSDFTFLTKFEADDKVTVGKPVPNASSHILDTDKRQVPIGVIGEMCLGGIGVSRGYINLPDLTAQRFVPDPFSPEPGARMFRTGDLGRLLPDGNFEILGRMDDQVKLKGYRIELDEVAAAMMRHPRVSAAAAVVKDKTHLVGFVVPADVDHDELRDVVAAALPAYMVPAVFVGLAVMPTNTNGKTDKKALAAMHVEIAVDALQTDTERALAAVWSQVLGVQVADIGRATSFFALGGDSISAIRLVAKAKQQGLTLSSALIFKAPTLAKMALAATVSETRAAVSSAPVTGSVALTPIQHMFFAHDWINISHFNQSFVVTPRDTLDIAALTAAIARLAEHHDMLRARFAQGDDGAWSQTLLPPSPIDTENVLAVAVESDDDALACIREAQESLSITHGPLLAVRLLHMHDGSQRLFFGIHHLVVDLVSWRVLLDDLETLLRGRPLAPKTLSFQAWAARMAAHAATLDAAPWRDLIGDHTTLLATQPPAAGVPVRAFHARAVLDEATTAQLDAANAPFNTNIQELVLAALVLSLADVAGCASSPAQLCIELEGHGREPFAADLDVSSTVGWFTSVFPVAFSASTASDIGAVVRQVKHKIRSVPLKGLSYGMIKHLAPPTADNAFVKAHGGHAVAFNYIGRFQSLEAADAYFVADTAMSGYWSVRHDDRMMHAISLNCAHDGPQLVLSATVEGWIVSEPTMQTWLDSWQVWMQRVVAHCVDPATHGGRTVSDVPLMPSQAAVEQAEAELAAVLSLRARDIVDMYPVTPLQAGFLSAMMRDASEYTVQSAFDVTGNMDVQRLRAAWHAVAMAHPIVRTVFVSTPSGLVQAVAKDDRTEWTELDGVWSADDDALQAATDAFMAADRARGFSMASASFHRFAVAHVANGRMRVFWTQHHSVADGWSLPILTADLMRACAGAGIDAKRMQFRDHVEWLLHQDTTASEQFWRKSLEHAADAGRLAPPKPRESELTGAKYGELHTSVDLPHLAAVCKAHGVTTSTVLRLAWALVLRHFTRSEHVLFGSVVSGRDGGIDGIDEIVGVMINTIAVPARLPLDASVATALADMQSFSADAIAHSHVGLVDAQRAAGMSSESKLFDTIMVLENYSSRDAGVSLEFALEPVIGKEFVDTTMAVAFMLQGSVVQIKATFEKSLMPGWFAHSMNDKLVDVLIRLCSGGYNLTTTTVADMDALAESQQAAIARFSHGECVPLPFLLVHHGFEARAKQHPDWRAIEHGDAHLSYGDLDACGSALAAALASHGVQRGSRVAVVMQRSIEFVVALVGVLKVGATIVPVDSSFPADRIQFMLDDASVCAIVTTTSEAGRVAQLSVGDRAVVVADARALLVSGVSFLPQAQHTATGDDDFAIIYTSGTTGKPKGVRMPHKGASNTFNIGRKVFGFHQQHRVAQFMAISFDGCQCEIWTALTNGATLVLREEDASKTLSSVDATIITPTGLSQLGNPSKYPQMRTVAMVGE